MRCQVLYNLRDAVAWISGEDLHDLFYALVGDPSPSGKVEFDIKKLKNLDSEAFDWLQRELFSLMLGTDVWLVHKMNLTVEQASDMDFKIRNNGVFPKECSLRIVPNQAVSVMQGLETASVDFEGGMVILSSPDKYRSHVIVMGVEDPMDYRHTTAGYWMQFMKED